MTRHTHTHTYDNTRHDEAQAFAAPAWQVFPRPGCSCCVAVQDLLAKGPAVVSASAAVEAAEADRPEMFINLPGLQDRLGKEEIDKRQRALVLGAHPSELFRTGTGREHEE